LCCEHAPVQTRNPTPKPPESRIGRIPVTAVGPVIDCGKYPAKAVTGQAVEVTATVFREGHEAVAATAVLVAPDGTDHTTVRMTCTNPGLDSYRADLVPDAVGDWGFRVEGWSDPYNTWRHEAEIKVTAGIDTELMLATGAVLLSKAAERPGLTTAAAKALKDAATGLQDTSSPPDIRLAAGTSIKVTDALAAHPLREMVSVSQTYPLRVDRPRAMFSSWYEIFPRSEGAYIDDATGHWVSGTLRTAAERLPSIAAMGFDIIYLTPIHPIGLTWRKGRNNSLSAEPTDPGSPYAIGSAEGGHDAIHPDLGTFEDFDFFVAEASRLGLEVALDFALQCSPDHPWVTEHPEWFSTRLDGTIAYAENPPKKYQDIYPLNFDNDPEGLYQEIRRVLELWISHGVTAFRVDNPHTKPMPFWDRLLTHFRTHHPDVLFLSEAFTRPAMMHTLAKLGFHQSYTYFAWRNGKHELAEYLTELSGHGANYFRPNFWPITPDILTPYMTHGGRAAYALRAILAATGAPSWGIYTGYEFVENVPRPGVEEAIDNEKYEFRPRPWDQADRFGLPLLLGKLNSIRRRHPALQRLDGLTIHSTDDDAILCFSKHLTAAQSPTGKQDTIIVIANVDPNNHRSTWVHLDLAALGIPPSYGEPRMVAKELLSEQTWEWGEHVYVELDPWQPALIVSAQPA
jgi:starch synthase (maltosyl-transferring)